MSKIESMTPADYKAYRLTHLRYGSDAEVREFIAARDYVEPPKPVPPEVARILRAPAVAMMRALATPGSAGPSGTGEGTGSR